MSQRVLSARAVFADSRGLLSTVPGNPRLPNRVLPRVLVFSHGQRRDFDRSSELFALVSSVSVESMISQHFHGHTTTPSSEFSRCATHPTCRALATCALVVLIAVGTLVAHADHVGATSSAPSYYLALGDSLATGTEAPLAGGYVDDLLAYFRQRIPTLQLVNLGCNNETTITMIHGGFCSYPQASQLGAAEAFLMAHQGHVAAVTLDIGGDDVVVCALNGSVDANCFAQAAGMVLSNLHTILAGLRSAGGTSLPILASNCYDPFLVDWLSGSGGQSIATQTADLDHVFSGLLSQADAPYSVPVADVEGAYRTQDFPDTANRPYGSVPVSVANVCDWLVMTCRAGAAPGIDLHMNGTGAQVMAGAFEIISPSNLASSTLAASSPGFGAQAPTAARSRESQRPSGNSEATLPRTGRSDVGLMAFGAFATALGTFMLWCVRRQSARAPTRRHLLSGTPRTGAMGRTRHAS
jgi:lysophospholipase L1-like esterase